LIVILNQIELKVKALILLVIQVLIWENSLDIDCDSMISILLYYCFLS